MRRFLTGWIGLTLFMIPVTGEAKPRQCGTASWYALTSKTASGERMNPNALTAAHPTLRFGSRVRVTNRINGRKIVVRINDRGPFTKNRIIDMSRAAASRLDFKNRGHAPVCIEVVG